MKAFQERLDNIPNKQAEIESLCREILSNPEENMGEQARTLVGLCVDEDVVVKQLAMLSCAAVFADLMPGYRIREDNEERADNAVLSKDVKKLRRYERRLLHHYRGFAELLVQVLALRAPNPPLPDEAQQQRRFRVVSQRALHQMQLVAVKALARVLMANPSFNYADMLVKTLVRAADLTHIMDGAKTFCFGFFKKKKKNLLTFFCCAQRCGESHCCRDHYSCVWPAQRVGANFGTCFGDWALCEIAQVCCKS